MSASPGPALASRRDPGHLHMTLSPEPQHPYTGGLYTGEVRGVPETDNLEEKVEHPGRGRGQLRYKGVRPGGSTQIRKIKDYIIKNNLLGSWWKVGEHKLTMIEHYRFRDFDYFTNLCA